MKAIVGALIIITVIVLYFVMTGAKKTVAPTEDSFQGPTEAPSIKGPNELPPQ